MISLLKGILGSKSEQNCVVEVAGVGYEVSLPASDLDRLPAIGEPLTLHTWLLVREDAVQLFGFLNLEDRALFKLLLSVAGVGPKSGLAVLSGLTPQELEQAVTEQDPERLTRLPGIGRKTAERLLLELKGKLNITPRRSGLKPLAAGEAYADALEALESLGYSANQARLALQKAWDQAVKPGQSENQRTAELVRQALKFL